MTELFIARKDDQFFQLSKVPISSDADTNSKYFLVQDGLLLALEVLNDGKDSTILLCSGRTSPGIKVLNVPTQDYKCRISAPSPTILNSKTPTS